MTLIFPLKYGRNAAKVGDDENIYYCMDAIWGYLSKIQVIGSSELKFGRLGKVARAVLVIPHSNASEERVFSMVRKNKTPFRPSLGLDGTLSSIIKIKLDWTHVKNLNLPKRFWRVQKRQHGSITKLTHPKKTD